MRHLEEGEIHAWLDGALDAAEADRVEAHVAVCGECAEAVAAARGLVAGASRILLSLDGIPAGVVPARTSAPKAPVATPRRHFWLTSMPVRLAASLMLVAGVGVVVARDSLFRDSELAMITLDTVYPSGPSVGGMVGDQSTIVAKEQARQGSTDLSGVGVRSAAESKDRQEVARVSKSVAQLIPQSPAGVAAGLAQGKVAGATPVASPPPSAAGLRVPPISTAVIPTEPPAGALNDRMIQLRAPVRLPDSAAVAERARSFVAEARGTSVIVGRVRSADTNEPLASVSVTIAGSSIGTMTGADGSFVLSVPPGTHVLAANRVGFASTRKEGLRVAAGDSIETSVTMAANAQRLQSVIVAGAAAASLPLAGTAAAPRASAAEPSPANQCFSITLDEMRLPATMPQSAVILLGPGPRQVADAVAGVGVAGGVGRGGGGGGGGRGGRGGGAAGAAAATSNERVIPPARLPLRWEKTGTDSILVRWPTGGEEIVLRLRLTPTGVVGMAVASNEVDPPRFAAVTGTTVSCARD